MKLKPYLSFVALLIFVACAQPGPQRAIIETDFGNIEIELYDQTPLHRDNFVKLAKSGFYDGLLFHRIIPNFVIQGGDPESKNATPEAMLGGGGPGYQIKAEIGAPHFKGTLAAARNQNPEKMSSGSQFYIVLGAPVSAQELDQWENNKGIKYNPAQRAKYLASGGLPSLDADYTVFGEVVSGMDAVEKIVGLQVNSANRPLQDAKMNIRLK
ncbi:MAG: peptidylprolyl isomerase [Saprospiraceae bacterium]|nr:peptidylprolyl isomerase [Saprospiraceae bacterium]